MSKKEATDPQRQALAYYKDLGEHRQSLGMDHTHEAHLAHLAHGFYFPAFLRILSMTSSVTASPIRSFVFYLKPTMIFFIKDDTELPLSKYDINQKQEYRLFLQH